MVTLFCGRFIINKEAVLNVLISQENYFNEKELFELMGEDLNNPEYAYTALYTSVINNKIELVKSLIQKGLDINIKDNNGHTLMFSAVNSGHMEMVKFLMQNGAEVNKEIRIWYTTPTSVH